MSQAIRRLLPLLLVLNLGACSTISGWFDYDDEDDPTQPAVLVDFKQTVKIKKLWSHGVGDGQGDGFYKIQPAISGDIIYAAAADGELLAVNRNSGKKLWDAQIDEPLSGGVGVYEGSLFLGSSDGLALRVDASSGEVIWSARLTGEVLSAPQTDGKVVVVHTLDGKLLGLDFDSGDILWTYDSTMPALTIRGTSDPIVSNGLAMVGFANGRVIAFDMAGGSIVWEVRVAIAQGRSEIERIVDVDGTMALLGKELYAASYQGRVVAIDVPSGRKLWQHNVSSFSGVSQGFGNIYVADENGTVIAFLRTGAGERWSQPQLAYRGLSRPTPVSSYLAVADFEGYVHVMSQVAGEMVGRVKADSDGVRADMLSDGNVLYVYGNSGDLIAYEITAKD